MKSRGFPRPCINRFLSLPRMGPRVRRARGPSRSYGCNAGRTDVTAPTTCAGYFRGVDTPEITPATGNLSRILLETFRLCVFRAIRLRLRLALAQIYSFNSRLWQTYRVNISSRKWRCTDVHYRAKHTVERLIWCIYAILYFLLLLLLFYYICIFTLSLLLLYNTISKSLRNRFFFFSS